MLQQFTEYLETQVRNHSIYVWGAQGQTGSAITEAWIRNRETSIANANRAIAYWQKQVAAGYGEVLRAFDCSGLGMYFLQNMHGLYKNDMSANTMLGKCQKIAKGDLRRGDWVFRVDSKGKAYHIGYVVDDALNVIEAKGRDDGVVKRSLSASGASHWNAYGRPDIFSSEIEPAPTAQPVVLRRATPYMRPDGTKELQTALNKLGYDCGTADGIAGPKTLAGITAFAKAHINQ